MSRLRGHLTSPARIVAVLALVAAMAGTAIAAGGDSALDKKLFKKVVQRAAPKLSVGSAKSATNAKSATSATSAAHASSATTLGGQPIGAFEQGSLFIRFAFTLPFGGQRVIGTSGPLTVTATCLQNATDNGGTPNQDIARTVISTSQDGAVFDGLDRKQGQNTSDFLDTTTPETERVFSEDSAPTGTVHYDAGNNGQAGARAADGSTIGIAQDATGLGENVFGAGCAFNGFAVAGP